MAHDTGEGKDRDHQVNLILVCDIRSKGDKGTLKHYAWWKAAKKNEQDISKRGKPAPFWVIENDTFLWRFEKLQR